MTEDAVASLEEVDAEDRTYEIGNFHSISTSANSTGPRNTTLTPGRTSHKLHEGMSQEQEYSRWISRSHAAAPEHILPELIS
jgi:hypothetical protein